MSAQGELFPLGATSARAAGEQGAQAAFAIAIRDGVIRPIGFCARTRGHGPAGGRFYVQGTRRPA